MYMKCLTILFFLLFTQKASAIFCVVDGGTLLDMRVITLDVYADLRMDSTTGRVTTEGYSISCAHNFPVTFPLAYQERTYSTTETLTPGPLIAAFKYGMIFGGSVYPGSLGPGKILLIGDRGAPYYRFPLKMYFDIPINSAGGVRVNPGSLLGTFSFFTFYNFNHPSFRSYRMNARFFARNSLVVNPVVAGDCAINNNAPIEVDFGNVDPDTITADLYFSPSRKVVDVRFVCPSGVSSVGIQLDATPSFDPRGIKTSNPDIAIAMISNGSDAIVSPGLANYLEYSLNRGEMTTSFTYSLIRKPGSIPYPGPFTASGIIRLTLP